MRRPLYRLPELDDFDELLDVDDDDDPVLAARIEHSALDLPPRALARHPLAERVLRRRAVAQHGA